MKRNILWLVLGLLLFASCQKQSAKYGFAVVIDPESYAQAQAEIDRYLEIVRGRGLQPRLVIDRWGEPDSIRACLKQLYLAKESPIEGCVFIGDIPVPMIHDAQHMTTAFKMDQQTTMFSYTETFVPSDRFYDSFDLEFDFLSRDTARNEYFYYSLRADCAQQLHPSIYSARIFPRTNARGEKYEKLRRYMQRVNQADAVNNPLDQMLYFSGQGFISESMDARIDEKQELYDHFPWMRGQQQAIEYIDHKRQDFIKTRLTTQMQYPSLDFAVLHHHGNPDVEYLSNMPDGQSFSEAVDILKMWMRDQMRHGKARGLSKAEIMRRVRNYVDQDLPESWFSKAEEMKAADEAFEYQCDLHVAEFDRYRPQCRLVSLDACYNGSFHLDESIQEAYLFGQGNGTLAVLANTVNVLQDKWANRYIGLLGLGMRIGRLAQLGAFLEQHLFGDPTFAFQLSADSGFDVNQALNGAPEGFWKQQLDSPYPALQMLAMDRLAATGKAVWAEALFDKFCQSESGIVRLSALLNLSSYRNDLFVQALSLALNDGHEMTQRFAANLAGRCGDPRLIEPMVRLASKNNTSERIEYDLSSAMRVFDSTAVLKAFDNYRPRLVWYSDIDSVGGLIRNALHSFTTQIPARCRSVIFDASRPEADRISSVRVLRNTNLHLLVPDLLDYLSTPDPEHVRLQICLWEALGWFDLSFHAPLIAEQARRIAEDGSFDESVRKEALKTWNRVK